MFLLKVWKKNTEAITGRYTSHRCHLDRSRKPAAGFRTWKRLNVRLQRWGDLYGFVWICWVSIVGFFLVFGCTWMYQVSDTSIGDFCTDAVRREECCTFQRHKKVAAAFLRSFGGLPGLRVHQTWQGYNSKRWDFLSQQGKTTAKTRRHETSSKESFLPSWERSGTHFKLTKKLNQLQSSSNYPNSWKPMVKKHKQKQKNTSDSPKKVGNIWVFPKLVVSPNHPF